MTINGTNVRQHGAKQHHVEFGHHDYSNESAWVRSAPLPHMGSQYIGFKSFSVDMMVKQKVTQLTMNPRDAIHRNISDIIASLMEPATLTFDGFEHYFKGVLKSHKIDEIVPRRAHKLTLEFEGYEYGDEVTVSGTGQITVRNPGNILSPLRLEIRPSASATNVIITGICQNPRTGSDMEVVLDTITANKNIILDGANGLFTEDGALKADIMIRCPPAMTGGTHTITCSAASAALTATVLPLYM